MYTRIVELTLKPDKLTEYRNVMSREVYPVLKKQSGFVDTIALHSETNPNVVLSITMWHTKNEAEHYHVEVFPRFLDVLKPLLTKHTVTNYNVETSTFHKIATGKAA